MKKSVIFILIVVMSSCSALKKQMKINYKAGISYGGVVENTDMTLIENTPIDAYSGATSVGYSFGVEAEQKLKKNDLSLGLDIIGNKQVFTYNDFSNDFNGSRTLFVNQFRVPVIYKIGFFNRDKLKPLLSLNLGLSAGYSVFSVRDNSQSLPDFDLSNFSFGPVIGLSLTPINLSNNGMIGFTTHLHRSFQKNYSDFYQVGEMPGISYWDFTIVYTLPLNKIK